MSLITRKPARLDTLEARIQRAKREGFACGSREAKLFRLAIGKVGFVRERALEWLNTVVDEGRAELGAQRALEREIEEWDMSCRIAFLVASLGRAGRQDENGLNLGDPTAGR
jgi:hypothetical protein